MAEKKEILEKVRYSDEELQEFKEMILEKLAKAKEEYATLKAAVDHSSSNDTEDTSPSFKTLEDGVSSSAKEELGQLAARQYKFIQNLEAAHLTHGKLSSAAISICRLPGHKNFFSYL